MLALASPASLKGVLTPASAAAHLAAGLRRVGRRGGASRRRRRRGHGSRAARTPAAASGATATVSDPLGRPVTARWLALPDGSAVVDSAEAVGLARSSRATSAIRFARRRGDWESCCSRSSPTQPRELLVGVGGTATVDGGAGMRRRRRGCASTRARVRVLCDVRNPLLGERGAARVFGPQKGADPDAVDELEHRLASLARARAVPRPARRREQVAVSARASPRSARELCDGAALVLEHDRLRRARAPCRPRRHR